MVNYKNAKIYRLISTTGRQYVGATTTSLSKRKSKHKYTWMKGFRNKEMSWQLFEEGDVDIILIENFPCETKEQLDQRERYWIENIEGGCINKNVPGRTKLEYKKNFETDKKYYQKHKEKINLRTKQYYERNKEQILNQQKEYYEINKDQILARMRANYKKKAKQNLP